MATLKTKLVSMMVAIDTEMSNHLSEMNYSSNTDTVLAKYGALRAIGSWARKETDKLKKEIVDNLLDAGMADEIVGETVELGAGQKGIVLHGTELYLELTTKKGATYLDEGLLKKHLTDILKSADRAEKVIEDSRKKRAPSKSFDVESY